MMEAAIDVYRRAYNERMADWKTDAEQLANAAAVIEADREQAATQERKRIIDLINGRMSIHKGFIDHCAAHDIPKRQSIFIAISELQALLRKIEGLPS
jgi:hypothetical protein